MIKFKTVVCFSCMGLLLSAGCHSAPETVTNADTKPLLPCGSGAAHVDRQRVRQLLLSQGLITPEMSEQQQTQQVNEYIHKRQQAFSRCQKENLP